MLQITKCTIFSACPGATGAAGADLPHPGPRGGGGRALGGGDGRRAALRHPRAAGRHAAQRPVRAGHAGAAEGRRRRRRAARRDAAAAAAAALVAVREKAAGGGGVGVGGQAGERQETFRVIPVVVG